MPTTKSAKKRLRQSLERRTRNRSARSVLKSQVKKVRDAATAGDAEKAGAEFRLAAKRLDQAAASGVIHRNAAARTKSRLSKAVKTAGGKGTAKAAPKAAKAAGGKK
jgi:small subunit ribosomal protein S20